MSASEREPVERWIPVDANDIERIADGERVDATMHEAGDERGELDRTDITIECVGGTPADDGLPMYGIGAGLGMIATGLAMAFAPGEISAVGALSAGVIVLAVVVGTHVAQKRVKRGEEVSGE